MQLPSVEHIYLFLAFFVPGFILHSTLEKFAVGKRLSAELTLLRLLLFSAVNYAVMSWLIFLLVRTPGRPMAVAAGWAFVTLLSPVLLGILGVVWTKKQFLKRFLVRTGLAPIHPVPSGWDFHFGNNEPYWVLVTLKDGGSVAGWYGEHSLASTDPFERDLYIEQVYEIKDDGSWTRRGRSAGILISPGQIRTVEFFRPGPGEEE